MRGIFPILEVCTRLVAKLSSTSLISYLPLRGEVDIAERDGGWGPLPHWLLSNTFLQRVPGKTREQSNTPKPAVKSTAWITNRHRQSSTAHPRGRGYTKTEKRLTHRNQSANPAD